MLRRILSFLLTLSILLSFAACNSQPEQGQPDSTVAPVTVAPETIAPTEPEPDAQTLYEQGRQVLLDARYLTLNITDRTSYTVGQTEFSYNSVQVLQLADIGTDAMTIGLTEKVSGTDFEDTFDECYVGGTLYTKIYDQYLFRGKVGQEEYLAQFAPAATLDSSLYGQITADPVSDGMLLKFSDPSGPETWAMPEDAQFQTASGTAFLKADGTLSHSTYTITYKHGPATITRTANVAPTVETALTITEPVNAADYKQIDWIMGPRVYDLALLPMFCSDSVSTTLTNTIISEAAACVYTAQSVINYHGSNKDLAGKVDYSVSITQNGKNDVYSQTELYKNGAYTVTVDGGKPEQADVTPDAMLEYCQEHLWENIVSLTYFEDVRVSETGGLLYLELDFAEEYGDWLNNYANSVLYGDEEFLNNLSSAYSTTECTGYIAIHPSTGLPTATGITYRGVHTIDGTDYALTTQADQSFDLASLSSYETAAGEPAAEPEPENKATPLFYHVTGKDGQELWLFGTIHVGDNRTGYLPQEIYDALDASDALAVEFDTTAFEESLETNTRLANQISQYYFYGDGSMVKDHLDEEIYTDAVKLLKASGNYSVNAEYMKPFLWSQSIENFYLKLGYHLIAEKGVDHRLLTIAKESGKKILDIESGLSQIQMFSGFSPELQALMLEDNLSFAADGYCADAAELYELWCAGDETALREEFSDEVDTAELTEEELAEYEAQKHLLEEYNQAMSYDRNDRMLDVAIDYLESGETVFYAVGLAHLLNNVNGLVDTLRNAGYTVDLVQFAE